MKYFKKIYLDDFEHIIPPYQKVYVRDQEHEPVCECNWIEYTPHHYEITDMFSISETDQLCITVKI